MYLQINLSLLLSQYSLTQILLIRFCQSQKKQHVLIINRRIYAD